MKAILLMLVYALCSGTSSSIVESDTPSYAAISRPLLVTSRKVSITFTGTVKSIALLGESELKIIPVDLDCRFGVTVNVESVTPRGTPLDEAAQAVFAIHSPARLFHATEEEVIGRKYRFTLNWEKLSSGSRFTRLTAMPIAEDERD